MNNLRFVRRFAWQLPCVSLLAVGAVATGQLGFVPVLGGPVVTMAILGVNAVVVGSFWAWASNGSDLTSTQRAIVGAWVIISAALFTINLVLNAPVFISAMDDRLGPAAFRWSMVVLVLGLGGLAHFFKRFNQFGYGMAEIVFGATTVFEVADIWQEKGGALSQWGAIVASAYIIARGLNNCHESIRK